MEGLLEICLNFSRLSLQLEFPFLGAPLVGKTNREKVALGFRNNDLGDFIIFHPLQRRK